MVSRLRIADLDFDVQDAELSATRADPHLARLNGLAPAGLPLIWGLSVRTRPRQLDGAEWAPRLSLDDWTPRIADWRELAGVTLRWSGDSEDPDARDPAGSLYVFTHESMLSNTLRVGRRNGTRFAFAWSGTARVSGDQPFDRPVRVLVSGELQFTGITIEGSARDDEAAFAARLAAVTRPGALRAQPIQRSNLSHSDGTHRASVQFLPVE